MDWVISFLKDHIVINWNFLSSPNPLTGCRVPNATTKYNRSLLVEEFHISLLIQIFTHKAHFRTGKSLSWCASVCARVELTLYETFACPTCTVLFIAQENTNTYASSVALESSPVAKAKLGTYDRRRWSTPSSDRRWQLPTGLLWRRTRRRHSMPRRPGTTNITEYIAHDGIHCMTILYLPSQRVGNQRGRNNHPASPQWSRLKEIMISKPVTEHTFGVRFLLDPFHTIKQKGLFCLFLTYALYFLKKGIVFIASACCNRGRFVFGSKVQWLIRDDYETLTCCAAWSEVAK